MTVPKGKICKQNYQSQSKRIHNKIILLDIKILIPIFLLWKIMHKF